ncbi:MAG: hypothetical protein M3Q71_18700 [Chloroflexota bacterium]|nr:hypothetical protein [Chloroflexota bacterium]MDP9472665.1 hypothetical protein [Chloroflexota bacterium]
MSRMFDDRPTAADTGGQGRTLDRLRRAREQAKVALQSTKLVTTTAEATLRSARATLATAEVVLGDGAPPARDAPAALPQDHPTG